MVRDQAISMFLPNATWLQPPGIVHSMIDSTWQPNALQVDMPPAAGGWGGQLRGAEGSLASAQKSDDGKTLVLRYINFHQDLPHPLAPAATLKVNLKGSTAETHFVSATMWSLASDDAEAANTPGDPTRVAPKKTTLPSFGDGTVLQIPVNSYVVVVASLA
jgi:alpha-L-arabinofuranosidase